MPRRTLPATVAPVPPESTPPDRVTRVQASAEWHPGGRSTLGAPHRLPAARVPSALATVLAVTVALGLAGCSPDSSDASGSSDDPAATATSATSATAGTSGTLGSAGATDAATDASTTAASTTAPTEAGPDTVAAGSDPDTTPATDRPFDVFVPSSYDAAAPVPLVVLLHGYTASGALQEEYFHLEPLAEERGFLYVHPDGTTDASGYQFWNATDACCNLASADVDDVAYLTSVIEEVQATYEVDPKRIFLVGHSNGGFMSYRMACERADLIAAIVSLAGATFADPAECAPTEPVSVAQIHGTADEVIAFGGATILGNEYPGAAGTTATWAGYDSCAGDARATGAALDLENDIAGSETAIEAFSECAAGTAVELWTIDGGSHIPALSPTFATSIVDFLVAHPKA